MSTRTVLHICGINNPKIMYKIISLLIKQQNLVRLPTVNTESVMCRHPDRPYNGILPSVVTKCGDEFVNKSASHNCELMT